MLKKIIIGGIIKMLFKVLIIVCFFTVLGYLLTGVVATAFIRALNPLKKLDYSVKTIYLTFDDGINPIYTPLLLDLLKEHNIKASFFLVASFAQENLPILQRMKENGHLIGLHSFKHKNQILQSPFSLKQDFKESMALFKNNGIQIAFYRPPWGHIRPLGMFFCKVHHLKMILWNVIIQDWKKDTTTEILCNKLQVKLHGNTVICLHDGRGKNEAPLKTIETLKTMIPIWKKEGYIFETVDWLYQKSTM